MADNKRFVSYMYEYRNDEKLQNAGYARIETRGNQCKIFVHITLTGIEGKLLKAYLFYRKPAKQRFAYLGNILMNDNCGELKVKSECSNVMNSDLDMEDMCGLIVYRDRQLFAACEWDGLPITHHLINNIENLDYISPKDFIKIDETSTSQMDTDHREDATLDEEFKEKKDLTDESKEEDLIPIVPDDMVNSLESDKLVAATIEETPYKNKNYYKDQEMLYKREKFRNITYEQNTQKDHLADISDQVTYMEIECIEPTYGPFDQRVETKKNGTTQKSTKHQCHPCAQKIFCKFPRIYPFEDNEIVDCVRMEPQDIGLLPMESWVLGNNSFLLHGYYTYQHLIFGRINTPEEIIYVLGVPGVYQNRESFMAKMFGFDYFKCAKVKEDKIGEFGYYYIPIQMN